MSSPRTWIAACVSSLGMLWVLLFSTPLQTQPAQAIMRQPNRAAQRVQTLHTASFTPPLTLVRARSSLASKSRMSESVVITITLQAEPTSRQDFRFHGDLGDFALDQPGLDDGDPLSQTATFTVTPGIYQVSEETPVTWHLRTIRCSLADQSQIQLRTGQATLVLHEGDRMSCTFVNERGVVIRTRSYHDRNGNRALSLGESYQSNQPMTIYRDENIIVGEQVTNQYGKANFNYLPAGEYAVCQTVAQNWFNSEPGAIDPIFGLPCYSVTLNPGEITTLWFGSQSPGDPTPAPLPTAPRELAVSQGADVASDDSGYDAWEFVDTDMQQNELSPSIFLPLAFIP